jgi:hypothetical protein
MALYVGFENVALGAQSASLYSGRFKDLALAIHTRDFRHIRCRTQKLFRFSSKPI